MVQTGDRAAGRPIGRRRQRRLRLAYPPLRHQCRSGQAGPDRFRRRVGGDGDGVIEAVRRRRLGETGGDQSRRAHAPALQEFLAFAPQRAKR